MTKTTNIILVLALALLLGASHYLDDRSPEWGQSSELKKAQQAEMAERRLQAAAQQMCIKERGWNVEAIVQPDGSYSCAARRGRGKTVIAGGAP